MLLRVLYGSCSRCSVVSQVSFLKSSLFPQNFPLLLVRFCTYPDRLRHDPQPSFDLRPPSRPLQRFLGATLHALKCRRAAAAHTFVFSLGSVARTGAPILAGAPRDERPEPYLTAICLFSPVDRIRNTVVGGFFLYYFFLSRGQKQQKGATAAHTASLARATLLVLCIDGTRSRAKTCRCHPERPLLLEPFL